MSRFENRRPAFLIQILLGAVVCVGLLASCGKAPPAAPQMGPLPVTVLDVEPQRVPTALEIPAQLEGAQEAEVRARVAGILVKRLYQEGELVAAGAPLFQIDRAPFEIALSEARARFEQTAREVSRLKPLAESRAISQKEYDDARSAHTLAEAALRSAELNLSWTTVTAPVAGVTGRALKSEGSLVSLGAESLLTTVYQTQPMWARASLGQADIDKLPGGVLSAKSISRVELVLADGSVLPAPGRINFLSQNVDRQLGARQLRAEFDNRDQRLLPGAFVRLRLITGEREGVFLVPQSAVLQTPEANLVMVVGPDNKATPRPVQLGEWRGRDWVVLGGLKAHDKVIIDNLIKVRPGAPVAPRAPGAAPAAAPAAKG